MWRNFCAAGRAPAQAFAVMEKTMFDDLKKRGVPMRAGGANRRIACWWRGNELDHLGAHPDRRGTERRRAIAAQGGNPAAGAFLAVQCRYLASSTLILIQSPAFWAGMVCYGASVVCLAGGLVQGAGEHGLSDAVAWVMSWSRRVSVLWLGESMGAAKVLGIALICAGVFLVSRNSA